MRIALATCSDLPDWEVDDRPLHAALEARAVDLSQPAWDDPDVDWASFDAVLIRTTWDYHHRREEFVSWCRKAAALTRFFNPASVVEWNTHKSYLKTFADHGIPTVDTIWLEQGAEIDLAAECAQRGWSRAFIKPVIGANAAGTLRFDVHAEGLAAAAAHIAEHLPASPLMIQPYIATVESHGEVSAIFLDGRFTHGVRKVPVPGDYRVQDDHGASDEPWEFTEAELAPLKAYLERSEDDLLYARFDMLQDAEGQLRLIELELVEPSLFFRHGPGAAEVLAEGLLRRARSA